MMQIKAANTLERKVSRNGSIVGRKIHESFFLIDISDNYYSNKCALYEINETGKFIWDRINGELTIGEITTALQSAIVDDVDLQVLINDVTELIESLIGNNFVEICTNG